MRNSLTAANRGHTFGDFINPKLRLLLTEVDTFLNEHDVKTYIVGGFVRDTLLGRETADIDLVISTDALEIAPRISATIEGNYFPLDKVNRIARVVMDDKEAPSAKARWELYFATLEGDIEHDLARRDFTINAMAIELSQLERDFPEVQVIDPFNGRGDLRQRLIRAVAETIFESDAARLLRAVRLAAELDFNLDKRTESLIQHHAHLIASVAGERIREELLRLLSISQAGQFLTYLDKLNLLTALFPELAKEKGVEQPNEHYWDVFQHSLRVVTAVDFLLRQGEWEYGDKEVLATVPWSPILAQHFEQEISSGSTRKSLLKLAALLHDIAKPQTKAIGANGQTRFLGHAQEGAVITADILERLRFSTKEIKLVETEVRYHLRPTQISQQGLPSRRAIYRYFRDTAEASTDILFLSLADHLATRGPNLDLTAWQEHTELVNCVISQHLKEESVARPPKLIDGHDLINIFGLRPGPEIGELLELVREAQASGEISSREEALSLIKGVKEKHG